jgi:ParB-like chromosome segregation protein Spo0J
MRNRVLEVRNIPAKQLRANPHNWRLHPDEQRSALGAMLEEIGFVGTLIARDTPDGIELIDGHLRADLADDAEVPVAIVDLNDDEAARVLATYDPLTGMALVDNDQLAQLLGEVDTDENAEFRRIIADLHRKLLKEEVEGKDEDAKREVPGMDLQPHEHYDYLVVLAATTQEWNDRTPRRAAPGDQAWSEQGL